jgi:ABC-type sugar transport system ATPase subunit
VAQLQLKKLEKTYPNGFKAVHGVDLDIRDGEFMVFVGPSGCAKSTILRMIAGLEGISGGELLIGGKVVNSLPPKQRGIAMVFQNYALYPHMKVYDNLAFGLKLAGTSKAEIDTRVREAARLLEMDHLLDRFPKQLSGGQAQRVAVGRAIVKRPEVFLFDEPLSNLDAKLRASMRVRLTELHRTLRERGQPSTVVYVTHDQVEAMTMGERICVLKDGEIQQVDTPTALYERPANVFVASFIGRQDFNTDHLGARTIGHPGSVAHPFRGDGIDTLFFQGRQLQANQFPLRAHKVQVLAVRAEKTPKGVFSRLIGQLGRRLGVQVQQVIVPVLTKARTENQLLAIVGETFLVKIRAMASNIRWCKPCDSRAGIRVLSN